AHELRIGIDGDVRLRRGRDGGRWRDVDRIAVRADLAREKNAAVCGEAGPAVDVDELRQGKVAPMIRPCDRDVAAVDRRRGDRLLVIADCEFAVRHSDLEESDLLAVKLLELEANL